MMKRMSTDMLSYISNYLCFHSCEATDLGLLTGKMGMVLFFYHYAQYVDERLFTELADDLLDDIFEDINTDTSLDFSSGLSGIGWGILYLLKNRFVEGNPNEILSDIDRRLMEIYLQNVKDRSLDGLLGYIYYFYERLAVNETITEYDTTYIEMIRQTVIRLGIPSKFDLFQFLKQLPSIKEEPELKCHTLELGLNGVAGWGLKQILL